MAGSRPSITELRAVCQPPAVVGRPTEEHWTGRLYARRVSIHVTRWAVGVGLSADAITWLMFLAGVAGAAVLFVGGPWPPLVTLAAIETYGVLDCSDGEVARWNRASTARGVYLDRISHYTVESLLFIALGYRVAAGDPRAPWLAVGLAGALSAVLARSETDLVDAARSKAGSAAVGDAANGLRPRGLRAIRRVFDFVPLQRLTGAHEFAIVTAGAAIVDTARHDPTAGRIVLVAVAAIAAASVLLHLVSILASDRLR